MKTVPKSLIIISFVIIFCTCVDPYTPNLKGYDLLLVVEGLITNEKAPYEVKLSKTIPSQNSKPDVVSDAVVFISDETGNKITLKNYGGGVYKTDSSVFIGTIGKTYILNISTSDGREYMSEPCKMIAVPEIDSIYFQKDEEYTNNQTETERGIRIFLDSKKGSNFSNYFRWEYEETWKFQLPTPKRYNYISESQIKPIPNAQNYCWKQEKSKEILNNSVSGEEGESIKKEPIIFIPSAKSDRLTLQYHILVKQYSISKRECDFWSNLKKVNESGGDIFGSQPYPVISNVSNINDPNEEVLGYFQVSAVTQKGKYITFNEVKGLGLPFYYSGCNRIETSPTDYMMQFGKAPAFDELYQMWTTSGYVFIEPVYDITGKLVKLAFSKSSCSDCDLTGTSKKPEFWVDLN